jgi:hypothetical protein
LDESPWALCAPAHTNSFTSVDGGVAESTVATSAPFSLLTDEVLSSNDNTTSFTIVSNTDVDDDELVTLQRPPPLPATPTRPAMPTLTKMPLNGRLRDKSSLESNLLVAVVRELEQVTNRRASLTSADRDKEVLNAVVVIALLTFSAAYCSAYVSAAVVVDVAEARSRRAVIPAHAGAVADARAAERRPGADNVVGALRLQTKIHAGRLRSDVSFCGCAFARAHTDARA